MNGEFATLQELMDAVAAGLPVRRMGCPEEVAEAVLWLASDAAAFVVASSKEPRAS